MALGYQDVRSALTNKFGFAEDRSGKHPKYVLRVCGKIAVVTMLSHSGDDIRDQLANKIARQMFLKLKDFKQAVQCPLTLERYLEILRELFPHLRH